MTRRDTSDATVLRPDSQGFKQRSRSDWRLGNGQEPADTTPFRTGDGADAVLKNRFVLEDVLGSGGMGTVYKARDLRKVEARDRNPFVAVKVLNNDFREHPEAFIALEREASKSQALSHPNIVAIFDFDKDGDTPFLTMELLEGQDLSDLIDAFPNGLPDNVVWPILEGVCDGLAHAHESNLVHADFKPGNVFVNGDNRAKILDFGIARAFRDGPVPGAESGDHTAFDMNRFAALTPAYASLEMLQGETPQPADDIYSLGVVMYLALTGQHPFNRLSAVEARDQQVSLQRPARLRARQWRMLKRILAFERKDRPQSVAEVKAAMFGRLPWRAASITAVTAVTALVLAISAFERPEEIRDVRQQVRQSTLLDAQMARISALVERPEFDDAWESQVHDEVRRLASLDGSEHVMADVERTIAGLYDTELSRPMPFEQAYALYLRGVAYGDLPQAREIFRDRLQQMLDAKVSSSVFDALTAPELEPWIADAEGTLARYRDLFGDDEFHDGTRVRMADLLERRVEGWLASEDLDTAREALGFLEGVLSDTQRLAVLRDLVHEAERRAAERADREQVRRAAAEFEQRLASAYGMSCVRMNADTLASRTRGLIDAYPDRRSTVQRRLASAIGVCLQELAAVDMEAARVMQQQMHRKFSRIGAVTRLRIDPCGLLNLVGNGAQAGRRGYCVDEMQMAEAIAPKLVVVPPPGRGTQRFAIGRSEVSWAEFNAFCNATSACAPSLELRAPVTNVRAALVDAYVQWLTDQTGFTYRLPTVDEWQHAAGGELDPNRNCTRDHVGAATGGPAPADEGPINEWGLIHGVGNVREFVRSNTALHVAGGSHADSWRDCDAQSVVSHSGEADGATGFRVLRVLQ